MNAIVTLLTSARETAFGQIFMQTATVNEAEKKLTEAVSANVKMLDAFEHWLVNHGVGASYADAVKLSIIFGAIIILALIANFVAKRIFLTVVYHVAKKTETVFDDILVEKKVFHRLAHLAPAIVIYYSISIPLAEFPKLLEFLRDVTQVFMVIASLMVFLAFVTAVNEFFQTLPLSKNHSIKGYLQVVKIIFYFVASIWIVSIVFGIDPVKLVSFLGASVAVLMFIFKDTILGLVASIQLSVNDMLRPGDWIEMPSRKADGIVQDISLTTVKVQNWDKTVTTIPTYSLVSDSFTNWRGMEEAEGRRMKRSIYIDMKSVKFYTENMLDKLAKNKVIARNFDVKQYVTDSLNDDGGEVKSPEHHILTNLGIFRAYMESYLKNMPVIHDNMTLLVHYLQPNENGLPLELVAFSKEKAGKPFEKLQSDIFDHILAILPEFEIRVFQRPTSDDFQR
jgi:miniconductance mechanosensitive channel